MILFALPVLLLSAGPSARGARTDTYTLSVSVSGPGHVTSKDGQISCPKSCSGKYDAKTDVTLSASPDSGAEFSGWKGCDSAKGTSCSVTMNSARSIGATFVAQPPPPSVPTPTVPTPTVPTPTVPASPPPVIRITAPGAGAVFPRASDLLVTVVVTARTVPTLVCFSVDNALTRPDPCNLVTDSTLGNSSYARSVPGLHPGRNTVTAWAVDTLGQEANDSRVFQINPTVDLRTLAIEPTQGIQFWSLPAVAVGSGGSRSGIYNGVRLAAGGRTVVRVYADAVSSGSESSITGARMQLYGFREGSGTLLPGSPLAPIFSPPSLGRRTTDSVPTAERVDPRGAYTFDLPESWTHGTIRLLAGLNALGTSPSIPECCYANNAFLLTGVRFYAVDPVPITPLEVVWRPAGGTYTRPAPVTTAFADALNLIPKGVVLYPYRTTVDVSAAYARDPTLANRNRAEWDALDAITDAYDRVGKIGYGVGVSRGWIAGMTGWYLRYGDVASTNSDRPRTSVAHEFGHELGFAHASTACGGGANGQVGEDWPPDQRGYIQGVALDRRPGSGGTLGPYNVFGTGVWYDFMSYCAATDDSNSWISVRNWQRLMGGPATPPDREAAGIQVWRAVGPTLHVVARLNGSKVEIIRVQPGGSTQTPAGGTSPYRLVVRDAGGRVISSTAVKPQGVHIDRTREDQAALVADVPAAGAAAVDVVSGATVLATRKASPSPPRVKIVAPTAGSTVGAGSTVTVRWRATDRDGGARTARLDYSLDDGRTWVGIGSTDGTSQMALPSAYFSASKLARVRVTVNDGFRESSAVSARFTALGAPPVARILEPQRTERMPADTTLSLVGQAFDDTGALLPGPALTWYDGARRLGTGRSVLAHDLHPGIRAIRLVARDHAGRTGSAVVRVRVQAAAPYFLRLVAPKKLSRTARGVRLVVRSSIAATLRAGGRSFAVDRRVRTVTVPVEAGSGTLSLRLVLAAAGKTTRVVLAIPRP